MVFYLVFEYYSWVESYQHTPSAAMNDHSQGLPAASLYERNKLRISAALNLLGDVGLLIEGRTQKNPLKQAAGWLYTIGAMSLTVLGSANPKQQLQELREQTALFLNKEATNKDSSLESSKIVQSRDTGFMANTMRFLKKNAADVTLFFYTLGAGTMLANGVKGYKTLKASGDNSEKGLAKLEEAKGTIGYGISSLSIKAASLALREDKQVGKSEGVVGWLKEKPLRLFGYGSLITESMLGWKTYGQWKQTKAKGQTEEDKKAFRWATVTTGSYALSDVVIATANKDAASAVGKMEQLEQENLEEMVAETIVHQSAEEQDALATKTAQFLETQGAVNGNAQELRQSIMQRVEKMQNKAWVDRQAEAPAMELQV